MHTGEEPFRKEPGAWHMINVMGYDADRKKVSISNQWGQASDATVSLDSLYKATLEPKGPRPNLEFTFPKKPGTNVPGDYPNQ